MDTERKAQLLSDIARHVQHAMIEAEVDGAILRKPQTDPHLECSTIRGERFELRIQPEDDPNGP